MEKNKNKLKSAGFEPKAQSPQKNQPNSYGGFFLKPYQDNIVLRSALDELFSKLDKIPVNELEEFTSKY